MRCLYRCMAWSEATEVDWKTFTDISHGMRSRKDLGCFSFSQFVWSSLQEGADYYVHCCRFLQFHCSLIPLSFTGFLSKGLLCCSISSFQKFGFSLENSCRTQKQGILETCHTCLWAEIVECWLFCMSNLANGWRKIMPLLKTALVVLFCFVFPTKARPIWFLY